MSTNHSASLIVTLTVHRIHPEAYHKGRCLLSCDSHRPSAEGWLFPQPCEQGPTSFTGYMILEPFRFQTIAAARDLGDKNTRAPHYNMTIKDTAGRESVTLCRQS